MTTRLRADRLPVHWILAILICFRIALAIAVLAASGHAAVPGFPRYDYDPLAGDAYGFYSAARELLSVLQRDALIVAPAIVVAAVVVGVAVRRRGRIGPAGTAVAVAWAVGGVAFVLAALVRETGAAVIGWPLVWSVALLPFRVVGVLDPDVAFGVALTLSLGCIAVIIGATYVLGRAAGGERVGALAATLVGLWPLLALVLGGHHGTLNGTWQLDVGLSAYTEPLSTALVVSALALVVRRSGDERLLVLAGALLGFAVVVRLSNVLIVACVVVWLAFRSRRSAVWAAAGAAAFAPAVLAYWPKGYTALEPPVFPEHPFALSYARHAWTDSLLWHPSVLAILLPIAALGTIRLRPAHAALLWSCIVTTAALYTLYQLTPLHPRFLFVVLPPVLVLDAAGVAAVAAALAGLAARTQQRRASVKT